MMQSSETVNPGNLQVILQYLAKCEKNEKFNDVLIEGSKRATYQSQTTQNELLHISSDIISEKIIADIKRVMLFSVMADKTADVSNAQQLTVVIRFVDECSDIQEKCLGFVRMQKGRYG